MAAKKKLVSVNIRLFEDDVLEAKRVAERDSRPYHAILREWLRRGRNPKGTLQ